MVDCQRPLSSPPPFPTYLSGMVMASKSSKSVYVFLKVSFKELSSKEQTKILRLRLGHKRITHQHLIDKNLTNICKYYNNLQPTAHHILDTCKYFAAN